MQEMFLNNKLKPTYRQVEAVANFLEQNPGIAKGVSRTVKAKQIVKKKWQIIASRLNTLGPAQKDGKGWAKYWADKKCALKKTCILAQSATKDSRNDYAKTLEALSGLDRRLITAMGGPGIAVNSDVPEKPVSSEGGPTAPKQTISSQDLDPEPLEIFVLEENSTTVDHLPESISETEDSWTAHSTSNMKQRRDRSHHKSQCDRSQHHRLKQAPINNRKHKSNDNLSDNWNRLADVEGRKVEVMKEAAGNILSLASAFNNLADAITSAAKVMSQQNNKKRNSDSS